MKPFDVHNFEAHGLAADVARLEAFGFGDLVGDDIDTDLLKVVIDSLQRLCQRTHVARRIELRRHLPLGAKRQKAEALLHGGLGFRVGDGCRNIDAVVVADEKIELVAVFGNRVAA